MPKTTRDGSVSPHKLALPDAIVEGRLLLYYQPIVRMTTGRVQHYEALLRLRDRAGRIIAPAEFLAEVQTLGLAQRYTEWVIAAAVDAMQERPGVRIHVNLFSECIGKSCLLEFIQKHVRNLASGRLGFEMTEDTVIANLSSTADWILTVKGLGCPFVIDDFGAGNTATEALVSLPVDAVKIDGALVTGLTQDPAKRSLVEAVSKMAKAQEKAVIAEWVESETIAQELLDMGICDGQGYFLGAPNAKLPKRMGRRRAIATASSAAT